MPEAKRYPSELRERAVRMVFEVRERSGQEKLPVRGYHELVGHLATLTRNTVSFNGRRLEKLSAPTPGQRRVFELLGTPVLLHLNAA